MIEPIPEGPQTQFEPVQVSNTGRVRYSGYWLAIFCIAGVGYLIFNHSAPISQEQSWLAGAIVILGSAPGIFYLLQGGGKPLPLLPLDGLFYTFAFGLPTFSDDLLWYAVSDDSITAALWLTIIGLSVLYLSYYLSGLWFKGLRFVRIGANISPAELRTFGWIATAAHMIYVFVPDIQQIPSAAHFFTPIGWIGLGILYLMHVENRLPADQKMLLFWIVIPVELIVRLTSGALYQVLLVGVFMSLVYWKAKKRLPVFFAGFLIGFFVLLQPVKAVYRTMIAEHSLEAETYLQRTEYFATATIDYYSGLFGDSKRTEVSESSVNRVAQISTFSKIVDVTPEIVPYWLGETYTSIFVSFIPRIIWSGKPTSTFGNDFGQRYSLLHQDDFNTSYNLAWLPEFYANFGTLGVVFGMAIVGVAFRLLMAKLDNPQANPLEYSFGLTLVFTLFYAESNLAAMWGGLIITFLTFYILLRQLTGFAGR